jgi:4-amino-4-deoxy-L-arabinose transferase-like glycosyltransferase
MTRRYRKWFAAGLLLALCAAVFLPGQRTVPPIDRDEARFAHASRQMAASGTLDGWVLPMIQERRRINKPPLIYWVQAATALACTAGRIEHDAIWMYRLPSVVFAMLAVFVTWRLGVSMFGRSTGLLAAILLAVCPVLVVEAHQARSDHLLLALTTAAMAVLWRIWRDRDTSRPTMPAALGLWVLVGLGVLVKGPVTPMVVALTGLAISLVNRDARWLRRTRPALGLLIVVALVAPWVVLISRLIGFREYAAEVVDEVFVRSIRSREGHWGPPGYHLVLLVLLFWPGSLLTAAAVVRAWRRGIRADTATAPGWGRRLVERWRSRRPGADAELFCVCWIVPSWIVFELVSTKLPHYTLPMYPALAILSARAVLGQARWIPVARRGPQRLGFGLWLGVGVLLLSVPLAAGVAGVLGGWLRPGPIVVLAAVASFASIALAAAGGGLALRWRIRRGQTLSVAAAILCFAVLMGVVLPRAQPLWNTPRLMTLIDEADPDGVRALAAETYHEDSLIFASRGRLERLADGAGADWLARNPGGLLIVPADRLETLGATELVGQVQGFNYSNGRTVDLAVTRSPRAGLHPSPGTD